ncbi:MAG: ABC transporter ATP-binding protein [Candidatus Poribacteria bacterium]|nr:ABC transporter ATP-binding protein [Candidatus Poribacteria bacterium]
MKASKFLIRLIRYAPGLFAINFVSWTVFHSLALITGLAAREFFDTLTGESQLGWDIWAILAVVASVPLARKAASFGANIYFVVFSYTIETLMRRNMLAAVLDAPGAAAMSEASGEAISRFRDDVQEINRYLEEWTDLAGRVVYIGVAFVVLFKTNAMITLVLFVPLPFLIGMINMASGKIHQYRREARQAAGRVSDFAGEMFRTTLAIKSAGAETSVINRFRELNATRRRAALKDEFFSSMLRSVGVNIVHIGTGVILLMAGSSMRSGSFTVGDFALFVAYVTQATHPIFSIANLLASHKRATVSFERMVGLMPNRPPEALVEHHPIHLKGDFPTPPRSVPTDFEPLNTLEVRGLTYRFPDTENGIHDVSFTLKRGSFTVVTGRIGSGKTTLLRTLLGLLPKENGEIIWNGREVDDPANFFTPPRSAYTPQVPRLFSEKLRENVLMGVPEDEINIGDAIRLSVMEDDLQELEDGLETVVGPRGVKLSGGQMQRSAAARMFARHAELLVFDDLSSALDVNTERTLWERVFAIRDATYLVVSHRHSVLQRADNILVLDDGGITVSGSLDELLDHSEEMRRLWSGDFEHRRDAET